MPPYRTIPSNEEPYIIKAQVPNSQMNYKIEIEQEEDGRYIAEIVELPGVLVYGNSQQEAMAKVQALALRVLADQLEQGELRENHLNLSFVAL